jgi:hypothetical protein
MCGLADYEALQILEARNHGADLEPIAWAHSQVMESPTF